MKEPALAWDLGSENLVIGFASMPERPCSEPAAIDTISRVMNMIESVDNTCDVGESADRDAEDLIRRARLGETAALGCLMQVYRNYLTILATTQLDHRLRRRVSPSDVVQDALLAAHRDFDGFRGQHEREFLAWMRQILINCLHHAYEVHMQAKRRDVRCEISLDQVSAAFDRSIVNFAQVLADRGPSPSAPVRRRESVAALADKLARLRPEYRDVIVLRSLQGLSFDEVAQRLGKRTGAVRMLWLRAIEKLNQIVKNPDRLEG
ncbi:MAG: sigma-70 family RNA polymerase sigma factor [Pirellulales bacterium]